MSESGIVSRDELLAMGCEEVVSQKGRKAHVIGEKVIAIDCIGCNSLKVRGDFGRHKLAFLGVNSRCKACERGRNRKYYEDFPEKRAESSRKWQQANPEKAAEHKRKWRQANPEKAAEASRKGVRKYREANPEKVAEAIRKWRELNHGYGRKYYEANPEIYRLNSQRRRARVNALPYDLTAEQQDAIFATFNGRCILTCEPMDLHLDHVIPLAIGHGGTTYGNLIPLRADLNLSKNASHIFEWFEANRERFNLSQRKFDELIEYLAQINEMSTQEYRAYVDWCFDNPRDINAIETEESA